MQDGSISIVFPLRQWVWDTEANQSIWELICNRAKIHSFLFTVHTKSSGQRSFFHIWFSWSCGRAMQPLCTYFFLPFSPSAPQSVLLYPFGHVRAYILSVRKKRSSVFWMTNMDLASAKVIFYLIFIIDNNNLVLQRSKISLIVVSKNPEPYRSWSDKNRFYWGNIAIGGERV